MSNDTKLKGFYIENNSPYYDVLVEERYVDADESIASDNNLLKKNSNSKEKFPKLSITNEVTLNLLPNEGIDKYEVTVKKKVLESYEIELLTSDTDNVDDSILIRFTDEGDMLITLPEKKLNKDISLRYSKPIHPNDPDKTVTVGEEEPDHG